MSDFICNFISGIIAFMLLLYFPETKNFKIKLFFEKYPKKTLSDLIVSFKEVNLFTKLSPEDKSYKISKLKNKNKKKRIREELAK